MKDEEVLDLADSFSYLDDFGRVVFDNDEKLLDFAFELLARRESYEV